MAHIEPLPALLVEPIVRAALREDLGRAGDITTNSTMFRQIGTASAEGSVAAGDIYEHLNDPSAMWTDKGAFSESTPVLTVVTD